MCVYVCFIYIFLGVSRPPPPTHYLAVIVHHWFALSALEFYLVATQL